MDELLPDPVRIAVRAALFLDLDGTLVPIAPRPDAVRVDPALAPLLLRLHARLGGAVAIVSGRALDAVDRLLAPARLPTAAEHGRQMRRAPDAAPEIAATPAVPPAWREAAAGIAARHPGTLLEPKPGGFVLHYRQAPHAAASLWQEMHALVGRHPGFALAPAHMAVELRPRGIDKGVALSTMMRARPFAGRVPVMIGDDVTDEDGFAAARALGGEGLHMARSFRSPARLAHWLAEVADAPHPRCPMPQPPDVPAA